MTREQQAETREVVRGSTVSAQAALQTSARRGRREVRRPSFPSLPPRRLYRSVGKVPVPTDSNLAMSAARTRTPVPQRARVSASPRGSRRAACGGRPVGSIILSAIVTAFRQLDKRIERLVSNGPPARHLPLIWSGLAAILAVAAWVHYHRPYGVEIDLFTFAIIYGCFFFFSRALLLIPICLLLNDLSYARPTELLPYIVANALLLAKWMTLGLFTVITLTKFRDTRRYQAVMQKDIALARTLQRALMPPHFESPCVRVDARIHQTHQIGGDFYWFRPFKEKYVVVSLGDIMGKGIPASMVMAIVMGFFYEWGKQYFSPASLLGHLNERLYSLWSADESWFVTMFYAIYDEETHELVYSSGGHQAALLIRSDDRAPIEHLKTDGLPIGIFGDTTWEEKRVTLQPRDRLVVFTDGVNEARNPAGEIFTLNRLQEVLLSARMLSAADAARTVVQRVRDWVGTESLDDDVAILVLDVKA